MLYCLRKSSLSLTWNIVRCGIVILSTVIVVLYLIGNHQTSSHPKTAEFSKLSVLHNKPKPSVIHVGIDVCGKRHPEAVTLIKSVLLLARSHVHLHLFLDNDTKKPIQTMLASLPQSVQNKFSSTVYKIKFPDGEDFKMWKNIHKPCASQNLFYTDRLPKVDAIINFDIDFIILRPIDDLWAYFSRFSDQQILAGVPRIEPNRLNVSTFTNGIPFYGQEGINTGLVLMNLTRMRSFGWTKKALRYFNMYRNNVPAHVIDDQVVTEIIFYFYPDKVYTLGCEWNFRFIYCYRHENSCESAQKHGVSAIHGVGNSFNQTSDAGLTAPVFVAVYRAFTKHTLGVDSVRGLVGSLKKELMIGMKANLRSHCSRMFGSFTKVIQQYS